MKKLTYYKRVPKAILDMAQSLMSLNEIEEKATDCFNFSFNSEDLLHSIFDENDIEDLAKHYGIENSYSKIYTKPWYEMEEGETKVKAERLDSILEDSIVEAVNQDLTKCLEEAKISQFLNPYFNDINISFVLSVKPEYKDRGDIDNIIDTLYNLFYLLEDGEI